MHKRVLLTLAIIALKKNTNIILYGKGSDKHGVMNAHRARTNDNHNARFSMWWTGKPWQPMEVKGDKVNEEHAVGESGNICKSVCSHSWCDLFRKQSVK